MTAKKSKWTVDFESDAVREEYRRLFESGQITREDNKLVKKWVDTIENEGLEVVMNTKFWGDHELYNEWKGHRSSCISGAFRIIYKVFEHKLLVSVVRITPDHNYRR